MSSQGRLTYDAVTSKPQYPTALIKQGLSLALRKLTEGQQLIRVAFFQTGTWDPGGFDLVATSFETIGFQAAEA